MDEKEKANADVFVKLYERQMSHYENTQGIEWKVNIGVWTLLAVAIGWAAKNHIVAPWPWQAVDVGLFFFAAAHGIWLWLIHSSEEADKALWWDYRLEAVALARGDAKPAPAEKPAPVGEPAAVGEPASAKKSSKSASGRQRTKVRRSFWFASELIPTVVLVIVLGAVLAASTEHRPRGSCSVVVLNESTAIGRY